MKPWLLFVACLLSLCLSNVVWADSSTEDLAGMLGNSGPAGSLSYAGLEDSWTTSSSLTGTDVPLSIARGPGVYVVSWPASATNWVLEESSSLQRPVPWTRVSSALYQSDATQRFVVRPASPENHFYRLRGAGPLVPGLTGQWSLDEGTGQVAEDVSGLGSTLFLANATWSGGRIGPAALAFNGGGLSTGGSRAWVSNANYRVLPPGGQPFTVSLWFNPVALTNAWRGLVGNDANGTSGWHVALRTPGPGTNWLVFAGVGPGSSLSVTGQTLLLPGQWHELTVTHDGTEGSLYLDGTLLARGTGSLLNHQGPIYFGGGIRSYDSFFGRIDEVRTYTNALSRDQISLNGYYGFDDNTGSRVTDSGVYGHHATLSNPTGRVPGKTGSGIDLSASQLFIPNDYHEVIPPTGGPFSISLWLLPQAWSIGRSELMSCAEGANNGWRLSVQGEASGQSWLLFGSLGPGGTLDLRAPLTFTNGVWTKLDLTYNGGIATVYVNGRKVQSDSGAILGSRAPLVLGASPGSTSFDGTIDDLRIYCHERDAAEIGPIATTMWETIFTNATTNIVLQGFGPAGKPLIYTIGTTLMPTNGTVTGAPGSQVVTYRSGGRKGPDAFVYTVSDGEFTSPPTIVTLSVVAPHWLSPGGGPLALRDGAGPDRAWPAGPAAALDAIWKTNNYYDCFFYAPGEYQTTGWRYLDRATANPGCKHIGSGSDGTNRTTIKLVNNWDPWGEGFIFAALHFLTYCDGFEVHDMLLDCNAVNNPKYAVGEPVWLKIPLVTAARVDTVRLLWSGYAINGLNAYRVGRASDFSLCARQFATNTYLTNCTALSSTGQVTVVPVGVVADELTLELDRRALGASFYGLAEIEVAGATVSLPTATIPGGGDSRLDSDYSILQVADGDSTSAWASGPEAQVEIVLPLAPGTAVSQLNLQWNCQFDVDHGQLGPASEFSIRARDATTHAYYDVPFVRHGRTAKGWETNTFGPLGLTNTIVTDQLSIRLTAREPSVDYYSLSEVTLQNGPWPVPLRIPTARTFLGSAPYSVLKAFDGADNTGWVSGTQGMIGAIEVSGSNLKFTHLKMVGFGTKAGAECFAFYVVPSQGPHLDLLRFGNVLIEDCVLTEPAPSNTDGLSAVVMVTAPPTSLTNAVVRRCTVSGVRSQFIYSEGFGVQHVENCLVEDCQKGAYYEPDTNNVDSYGQVIIRSNRFLNVNLGVYVQSHPKSQIDSIACLANEIVLTDSLGLGIGACDTCWEGDPGSITNMTVLNNVIRYASWTPLAVNSAPGLYSSDIHHAVFGNNVVVLGPPNALRVRNFPSGLIRPPKPDCDQLVGAPPGDPSYPISLDTLPPGYRRAWFNNRDLTGALLEVRFSNWGVDGPASQQQSPE